MRRRVLVLLAAFGSSALATGCAARSSDLEAGTPDERRQQIALLDRRIAEAEAELGLRWASPPPPPASRLSVTGVPSSGESEVPPDGMAGGAPAPAPEPMSPPPPAQAPMQQEAPGMDAPTAPSQRETGPAASTCARVCRSVLAICDASRRICRLAEDLEDDWSQGRCEAATRSCDNAEGRAASTCGDC